MLEVKGLVSGYGKNDIVKNVSFNMEKKSFTCILGANGCGKTTLLKTILCMLPSRSGKVLLDGQDINKMPEIERAKRLAYIPQAHMPPFPFSVEDVVLMGRTPYLDPLSRITKQDKEISENAMEQLGILHLAKRSYTQLSGGQRQLVIIARAITQEPDILIMDEPTNNLDFGNQYRVLEKVTSLVTSGLGVMMVTHDPDHALYCNDKVIIMENGKIIEKGSSHSIITKERIESLYDTRVKMVTVPIDENRFTSVCVPVPKYSATS